ncbi:hypothetical protein AB0K52_05375 [Glycomyces sp. NPDC049804]|uniref:hypothetical protein n=1 Tax=Glycomyces sp. NPDC049804 TaxID=3154363 RepID=UPI003415C131
MDHDPDAAARPDPVIYVEPAPFEPGVGEGLEDRARVRDTALIAPAPALRCPHRVNWWDLQAANRIGFVLVVLLVWAAAVMALAGLPFGIALTLLGYLQEDLPGFLFGVALSAIGALLLSGVVVCHRVWRRLHRPGLLVCALNTFTPPLVLVFVGYMVLEGAWPWLVVFVVPPVAEMIVLWWFRSVLYSGATCVGHPWLPPTIAAMLKG